MTGVVNPDAVVLASDAEGVVCSTDGCCVVGTGPPDDSTVGKVVIPSCSVVLTVASGVGVVMSLVCCVV